MGWFTDQLCTPGCDTQHRRQRHCRGGLTTINKLNRSPYSKPTNEVAAHVVVAGSSAVVGEQMFRWCTDHRGELAYPR